MSVPRDPPGRPWDHAIRVAAGTWAAPRRPSPHARGHGHWRPTRPRSAPRADPRQRQLAPPDERHPTADAPRRLRARPLRRARCTQGPPGTRQLDLRLTVGRCTAVGRCGIRLEVGRLAVRTGPLHGVLLHGRDTIARGRVTIGEAGTRPASAAARHWSHREAFTSRGWLRSGCGATVRRSAISTSWLSWRASSATAGQRSRTRRLKRSCGSTPRRGSSRPPGPRSPTRAAARGRQLSLAPVRTPGSLSLIDVAARVSR